MSDLKSSTGISADGGNERTIQFGANKAKSNVVKRKSISYPALTDHGEHELAEQQESGPGSKGRMPKQMSGGGT